MFSQDFPIPAEGSQWNNAVTYLETIEYSFNTERIETHGDTLIMGILYKKLYLTWAATYHPVGDCEFKYNSGPTWFNYYKGAIRTNNSNRVLYIAPQDTVIRTLYDFSLNVGDTLHINGLHEQYSLAVTRIDSILIAGEYRKRIETYGILDDVWIEGIGSVYGLFASIDRHWEKHSYELTCYTENGVNIYPGYSGCNRCNLVSSNLSADAEIEISIYPNPIIDKSNIILPPQIIPVCINIYDESGCLLYSKPIELNEEAFIERNYLKPGILLLEIQDINEYSYFQKLIVI